MAIFFSIDTFDILSSFSGSGISGSWYLLETNDDVNKLPLDPRRPIAESILAMILGSRQQSLVACFHKRVTTLVPSGHVNKFSQEKGCDLRSVYGITLFHPSVS